MAKIGVEMLCEGELLDTIKQGIVFPINDADLEKEPEEINAKVSNYEEGKKIFLAGIGIAAEAILRKLSPTSKKIVVTLTVEEDV